MEDLIEVAHSEKNLVGQPRRKSGIQHQGIILYVNWRDFEVVAQVRARGRQRQTRSGRLRLAALPREVVE